MNRVKKETCRYLKWLFPLLFVGYFACISLFEHAHIIDGVIIVHSHAVHDGNAVPHQHNSKSEIFQFHFLSHFNAGDGVVNVLSVHFLPYCLSELLPVTFSWGFPIETDGCLSLRAPPIV